MAFNFNSEHYIKVREARKETGLPIDHSNIVVESSLVGREVISVKNNEIYKIQSVHRMWHHGWYEVLLLVNSAGSHAMSVWRLFNCNNKLVVDLYDLSQKHWKFVD